MGHPGNAGKPETKDKPTQGVTAPTALFCSATGCKTKPHKFDFCSEHFNQFKFGLITKSGKPVPDYEKKFDHYQLHKKRVAGQKAA